MANFIKNIGDYFSGGTKVPPNPDTGYNIALLEEAKKKITTKVFTRFFTKPTVAVAEFVAYLSAVAFIVLGAYFTGELTLLFRLYEEEIGNSSLLQKAQLTPGTIPFLKVLMYIICAMPTLIFLLLGRTLTQTRRRISTFTQVEDIIENVIYNLKNEKTG